MAVTQIDLDDAALAEVMRIAGVHTTSWWTPRRSGASNGNRSSPQPGTCQFSAEPSEVVDLLVCGTAAIQGLVVLHDDADYELAARHLPDVTARRV